ncbi:maleylpyruvate isomerase family mycothiol-dependent enzyme [Streptomyces panaciradicis]|uniref:maleylpyruvate isomerase family mycothiol-dependent enzyme n=1 Tax=Streptomyces panaciradicis TaxID=1470261 RepID=UPI00201CD36F|nr:maleylpyruvate isomerase family mycothiol-dependent enzyme [Streptomyces panaciradicis]MCL6674536.1 maleylpyruvate isomerase family mycothiol-dependent enzyme [Streptomyces panaciradicis]
MSPARKRARTYDSAKIRKAVAAQFDHVREAVGTLGPEQLALPTRLGDWSVRELVAHIGICVDVVARLAERPEPPRAEITVLDWAFGTAANASRLSEAAREIAGRDVDADASLTAVAERLSGTLAGTPDARVLAFRTGALTLADLLVTRTVELVVHTDDLNAAVPGLEVPYDRQALAACTRLLADALAAKAPGGSTEVRVPPYAVVQCVEGPRHTRGTPPNVVETDPLTWVRLATGRLAWTDALADAKVSASGERADLGGLLPVMS